LSARLANAHGKAFIELVRGERQRAALDNLMFLKSQASELEGRVADAERGLAVYAEQNSIITLESNESLVVKQMAELNRMITEATSRRVKSEAELKEAKGGAGVNSSVLDDESIRTLRTQLKESEAEYAMLSQKFQPSYPKMQQLKARIDDLRKSLNSERKDAVAALDAQYNSDMGAEHELRSQMDKLKESAFDQSRKLVQYNIMKREYESLKDLHQTVLRQLKEAQMSSENRNSNIIISDLAAVPDFPSKPARKVNMLLAFGFGPMFGFMIALLIENMAHSIKDPEDVNEYLGLPSLGVVPIFDGRSGAVGSAARKPLELIYRRQRGSNADVPAPVVPISPADAGMVPEATPAGKGDLAKHFVTIRSPRSIAAEAFQTIRTGLLLSRAERPPQVVLVTSAKKHEGKTTLVSNLGITLAQAASRTILIDCDLRRPSLHRRFGIDQTAPGLVEYLTGRRSLEEVMVPTQVKNLTVLPAGSASPNPAALIGSRRMVELLKILSERYEYVLLDSPPILPVADALMLSSMGAGVILVVHGKTSHRRQVQEAARRLRQARAGILGVVVNQSNVRDKDYYDVYGDIESFEVVPSSSSSSSEAINA
jgi:capsular exopolysaccharide synthesis family protein